MFLILSDMEGVFTPEIWIAVSQKTGIDKLSLTTRDISDYDQLMKMRIEILDQHGLKLKDIQDVIAGMDPLPGAKEFLDWARKAAQIIVISDTFVQFADPLMDKLGRPTLFCNSLVVDESDMVTGYTLRKKDGKRHAAEAMKGLNFTVIAVGDSYNDVTMLKAAHRGILFCPPDKVVAEFPNFPVARDYATLKSLIETAMREL